MPGRRSGSRLALLVVSAVDGLTEGEKLTLEVAGSDAPLVREGKNRGKPLARQLVRSPQRATFRPTASTGGTPSRARSRRRPDELCGRRPTANRCGSPGARRSRRSDASGWSNRSPRTAAGPKRLSWPSRAAGRPCPALRLQGGRPADEQDGPAIWLQARQHAWESGSSWVCRGAAEWLAGDDRRAERLRERCEIYIVPIMDIDNTATGNGGKECLPQDHNRDWTDKPHHAEVAAAQKHLLRLADEKRLALFVDLHNPGPNDKQPFFYFCPEDTLDRARPAEPRPLLHALPRRDDRPAGVERQAARSAARRTIRSGSR